MSENFQRSTSQKQTQLETERKVFCRYEELDSQTRQLIEGVEYNLLPNSFSLDHRLVGLFTVLRSKVASDREARKVNPMKADMIRRATQYFEESEDEDSKLILKGIKKWESEPTKDLEHHQNLYLIDGNVVEGDIRRGEETFILIDLEADGIAESKVIVNIHTHPNPSLLSRGDLSAMLVSNRPNSEHCLYMLAAQELNVVGVLCSDAKKLPEAELKDSLKLGLRDNSAYLDELDQISQEIPESIADKEQIKFIQRCVDSLRQSQKHKVGIYYALSNDESGRLVRVQNIDQIIKLSELLSKF